MQTGNHETKVLTLRCDWLFSEITNHVSELTLQPHSFLLQAKITYGFHSVQYEPYVTNCDGDDDEHNYDKAESSEEVKQSMCVKQAQNNCEKQLVDDMNTHKA